MVFKTLWRPTSCFGDQEGLKLLSIKQEFLGAAAGWHTSAR